MQIYWEPDIFFVPNQSHDYIYISESEWKTFFYREKFDHVSHDADDNGENNEEIGKDLIYAIHFAISQCWKIVINLN